MFLTRSTRWLIAGVCGIAAILLPAWSVSRPVPHIPVDSLAERSDWVGRIGLTTIGTPLAIDTGADGRVDTIVDPASATVTSTDVPIGATLVNARLYWGGTQDQSGEAACSSVADSTITLTAPHVSATPITAEECGCSDGGSSTYDVHLCTADITTVLVADSLQGTYSVGDYSGLIADGATDNASFSVLIVYRDHAEPYRRIKLVDGVQQFQSNAETLSIGGIDVTEVPSASLTYYSLEGDVGGSGTESVSVDGMPGVAGPLTLSDAVNPADNPMNQTINVESPAQTGAIGIDLDRFDISSALTALDTSIEVTLSAGTDKWWLGFVAVAVEEDNIGVEITERAEWTGRIGLATIGAPLAVDTGVDGNLDTIVNPASATVTSTEVPVGATLVSGRLYWGGTQNETAGACSSVADSTITLTAPDVGATTIVADECRCSDGGSSSYDVHLCTADITSTLVADSLQGGYSVGDYSGLIADGATDNASFSLVLVYRENAEHYRTIKLLDGIRLFQNEADTLTVAGFGFPKPAWNGHAPSGSLTYYSLEGDVQGSGIESVTVKGSPGGATQALSDAVNPTGNPMNHTINVQSPTQTETIGMDLDRFDITSALTGGDKALDVELSAGSDKWWLGFVAIAVEDDNIGVAVTERSDWVGRIGLTTIGAPLAIDTGADGRVDTIVDPASATVASSDVPIGATLVRGRLYWGGTQSETAGACSSAADSTITFTAPDVSATPVVADECRCSDGGSTSYDVHLCTADITTVLVADSLQGTYSVGDYSGLIADGATDNASFALILVYGHGSELYRRIKLMDGLQQFENMTDSFSVPGFDVPAVPEGSLTYYALEGDVAGGGIEEVSVEALPGGLSGTLSDAVNPADNPMNQTINVQAPAQTGTIGIDLDRFDVSPQLTPGDNSLDIALSAGSDKWWLGFVVVSVAERSLALNATVLLEGAYAGGGMMAVSGLFNASRPVSQPYSDPVFDGTILEYDGTDSLNSAPDSVIDWIVVHLRTGLSAGTEVAGSRRVGWVLEEGSLAGPDGAAPFLFPDIDNGNYRVVICHRNHMCVMSDPAVDFSSGTGVWDAASSISSAYTADGAPMKDLSGGRFGLFACDINLDGQSTATDFNSWLVSTKAVEIGYFQEDCNLDGQATASDFNLWLPNTKTIATSQVP